MRVLKDVVSVQSRLSYFLQLEKENLPQKDTPSPSVFFPWREKVICESHYDKTFKKEKLCLFFLYLLIILFMGVSKNKVPKLMTDQCPMAFFLMWKLESDSLIILVCKIHQTIGNNVNHSAPQG